MKRRQLLKNFSIGSAGLLLPEFVFSQGIEKSLNELKIPQLLPGVRKDRQLHYNLAAQSGVSKFLPDLTTPTIGINGDFLGPTLHFKNGDDIAMHIQNNLNEETTLHWHGLHVPAKADGGPAQVIGVGKSWDPSFKVMQKAGTFWYHSHLLGKTGEQVYRGLAGLIIIEDDESAAIQLPSEYGVDDIPLIVQDRRFNQDGSFRYAGMGMDIMSGLFGDTILVNGTLSPVFTPTTSKVRFRLLNASNARTYSFAFDDGRKFQFVASDGGLLPKSVELQSLELAPAERAEIVVDFSDGKAVNLISLPMAPGSQFAPRGMMGNMRAMNNQAFNILALQPQSNLEASQSPATNLTSFKRMQESEANRTRQLTLSMSMGMGMRGGRGRGGGNMMSGMFQINGEAMDMNVINQRVSVGDTEIWEITNDSMMMHPFHIHHGQFQILDRDGRPPAPQEMGFKDTVKVGPGQTVRFIMKFEDFSDAETAYMYHCHILEHEDNGMMGQFTVS
ncbi:MAG: oxidase [SAR86 cluster bacterium]|uniref:Oxidase n=1 Tax=SAR86 cluster bacterium TaxID=2030880 RepID=A0A2A5AWF5_9GAMM|nr:MAG: oxidase [SAR86 cluster bacterium]